MDKENIKSYLEEAIEKAILNSNTELERRIFSKEEKDAMDTSDFGDPENRSFPIKTAEDVVNASERLHDASGDKEKIKSRIKSIAKRKGFPLPKTWQEDEGEERLTESSEIINRSNATSDSDSEENKTADDNEPAKAEKDKSHEKMTGQHAHANEAFGDNKSHLHSHVDDNVHKKSSIIDDNENNKKDTKERNVKSITSESLSVYLPITRVDSTNRTVTGQATVEQPDAYGTIFGYYPEAWLKWRGNMREQHDPKKAVGKALEVIPDDKERAIYVTSKVSRGAQDTWLKIEDGVLSGYSAAIIPDPEFGNDITKWPKKEYNGKLYPYLPRYTVSETSYVDNPATPGCNISLVRSDGFITSVIEAEEDDEPIIARAGARMSSATKSNVHDSIGHTLKAASSQMQNCGCDDCTAALKIIDPDNDGDVDLGGYGDTDSDWQQLYNGGGDQADVERVVTSLIEKTIQPVYMRLQNIAGVFARSNSLPVNIEQIVDSSITRAFTALDSRIESLPTKSSIDEVRAELSAVKDQVDKIADQPIPGGPVLNASAVEKRIPTDARQQDKQQASFGAVYEAIKNLSGQGNLDTTDKQVAAMAAGLSAQRGGR